MATPRQALLILGMHRSGTSALTRLLNIYGAALPTDLLPANSGNEKGYWEASAIVSFHDRVLEAAGSHWDDPTEIPAAWFASDVARAFGDELAAVVTTEFGDAGLFVVKDPRACRLVPLWRRALARIDAVPLAVLLVRHPLEVESSLQRRDGRPDGAGIALWLQHVLSAEADTRDIKRVVLTYEQLLADRRVAIDRIEAGLGLSLPLRGSLDAEAEAGQFIDPMLRHERRETVTVGRHDALPRIVRDAYDCLESVSRSAAASDTAALDVVRERVRRAEEMLAASLRWSRQQELRWLARAQEEAAQNHEARVSHDVLATRIRELEDQCARETAQARVEHAEAQTTVGRLERELAEARSAASVLRAELHAIDVSVWGRLRRWSRGAQTRP